MHRVRLSLLHPSLIVNDVFKSFVVDYCMATARQVLANPRSAPLYERGASPTFWSLQLRVIYKTRQRLGVSNNGSSCLGCVLQHDLEVHQSFLTPCFVVNNCPGFVASHQALIVILITTRWDMLLDIDVVLRLVWLVIPLILVTIHITVVSPRDASFAFSDDEIELQESSNGIKESVPKLLQNASPRQSWLWHNSQKQSSWFDGSLRE